MLLTPEILELTKDASEGLGQAVDQACVWVEVVCEAVESYDD